ncbi:MAG: carboxymuconolactone decarboxylase family protein [Acidimicrobiia bacterium]|nr:carboxymuconolactone decarboxylase family protein [Acidimicrobiia bacterium]
MSDLDHPATYRQLVRGFRTMERAQPDVMRAFTDLHRAALAEGALSTKTKELIALAIGIASRCEGCIAYHVRDALRAGATRAEIEETVGVAILMGGGPAAVYGSEAFDALAQFEAADAARRGPTGP